MDIILVRHGQSVANEKGLLISNEYDGLTDEGKMQSILLESQLKEEIKVAKLLISSTWKRALATAEILFSDRLKEIHQERRITETNAGLHGSWYEKDFNKAFPDFYSDLSRKYDGGESHTDMSVRVNDWVEEVILSKIEEEGLIICVTHGGPISVIIQNLMGMPFESRYPSFTVPNASATYLKWRQDLNRYTVIYMGRTIQV